MQTIFNIFITKANFFLFYSIKSTIFAAKITTDKLLYTVK